MFSTVPLLRSPPFPRVPSRIAAVCKHAPGMTVSASGTSVATLIGEIRDARVGGTFWGSRPIPNSGIQCWRSIETFDDVQRLRSEKRGNATNMLVVMTPRLRAFAPMLRQSCAQLFVGVVDPWHMLDHVERCDAVPGSELALLALIARAPGDLARQEEAIGRLLHGIAYRDPFTGGSSSPERSIEILAQWRQAIDRNRGLSAVVGVARWKQPTIGVMLWAGGTDLPFYRRALPAVKHVAEYGGATRHGAVAVWPAKAPAGTAATAKAAGVRVTTIEDGFIRSRGLGSDCVPPLSVVVDGSHPHYDPSGASLLETLIQTYCFDAPLIRRAERLIATLVAQGVGKYDVGRGAARARPAAQRVVLIAGQVEDDESWVLGGADIASNLDLLRRVRAEEPKAWLIFRPHPDVEAGHRVGRVSDRDAMRHVDEIDARTPLPTLLDIVDAVHVLTSLTGFEALLRGREVVVHGTPFYAGWGVTRDLAGPVSRRRRRASVTEIAAAAFILYPYYLDPVTGLPCTPELLVERLIAGRGMSTSWLTRLRRLRRFMPFAHANA